MPLWQRVRLLAEALLLYGLTPVIIYHLVYIEHIPPLKLLPGVLVAFLVILLLSRRVFTSEAFLRLPSFLDLLKIFGLFAICGSALAAYAYINYPQFFLAFPERAPALWLRVMILYPLISVTAQEVFYRVLFFHRYAPLFGANVAAAIFFNAALFAFMHATLFAYGRTPFHWQAIAISFLGGLIFAYRFARTQSYWAVALEHSLYGDLIFTIGLGMFFFTGVANL